MSKRGKLKREAVVEEARQRFEQAGEVFMSVSRHAVSADH